MERDELIGHLTAEAGRSPTAAEEFLLGKSPAFQRALQGDPEAVEQSIAEFREAVKSASRSNRTGTVKTSLTSGATTEVRLAGVTTAGDRGRAAVLSARLGRVAAADPDVQRFRQSILGTRDPLPPAAARALLESPILPFMTKAELDQRGIPVVGHAASVILIRHGLDATAGHWDEVKAKVKWKGGRHEETRRLALDTRHATEMRLLDTFGDEAGTYGLLDSFTPYLVFPDQRGRHRRVRVHHGSVFEMLRRCAKSLADRMGWPQPEAVWFLLAGAEPRIPPVTAARTVWASGAEVVTITTLPFVSRRSVADAFTKAAMRSAGRPVAASSQAVVDFAKPLREQGRTWPEVKRAFDREKPAGWRHFSDHRSMRRTFVRGTKRAGLPTRRATLRAER